MKKLIMGLALCLCVSAQTTTWFGVSNSALVYGGTTNPSTCNSRACLDLSSTNAQVAFVASGSAVSLSVDPTTALGCTFIVNGTSSTPTLTAATWQVYQVYSGADQANTIVVTGSNTCQLDRSTVSGSAGFIEVTGGSPSVSFVTGYNTPVYLTTPLPSYVSTDGTMYINSASTGVYSSGTDDAQFRIRGTCSDLWGWGFQGVTQYYNLYVNQVQGTTTQLSSAGWSWIHLGSSLNSAAEAEYMVTWPYAIQTGILELMCGGGGFNTHYLPPRKSYAAFGDSITQSTGGNTSQDSTYGYPRLAGQALGYGTLNFGVNGASVVGTSGSALDFRTYDLTSQGVANGAGLGSGQFPSIVSILGGVNDIATKTPAQVQASYQDMLYRLVFGMPSSTVFYCLDILDTGSDLPTVVAPYRAAIAQAVASMQSPRVIHVPTAGWWYWSIQATAIGTGLHPNPSGYATIGQKWIPTVKQAPWVPVAAVSF